MHFLIQIQYQGDFSGLVKWVYSYDSCSVLWHCIYNMRNIITHIYITLWFGRLICKIKIQTWFVFKGWLFDSGLHSSKVIYPFRLSSSFPIWVFCIFLDHAPLTMGFSRQEYWNGLPFPSPGDLPNPGIEPGSPALQAEALLSKPPENRRTRQIRRRIH